MTLATQDRISLSHSLSTRPSASRSAPIAGRLERRCPRRPRVPTRRAGPRRSEGPGCCRYIDAGLDLELPALVCRGRPNVLPCEHPIGRLHWLAPHLAALGVGRQERRGGGALNITRARRQHHTEVQGRASRLPARSRLLALGLLHRLHRGADADLVLHDAAGAHHPPRLRREAAAGRRAAYRVELGTVCVCAAQYIREWVPGSCAHIYMGVMKNDGRSHLGTKRTPRTPGSRCRLALRSHRSRDSKRSLPARGPGVRCRPVCEGMSIQGVSNVRIYRLPRETDVGLTS